MERIATKHQRRNQQILRNAGGTSNSSTSQKPTIHQSYLNRNANNNAASDDPRKFSAASGQYMGSWHLHAADMQARMHQIQLNNAAAMNTTTPFDTSNTGNVPSWNKDHEVGVTDENDESSSASEEAASAIASMVHLLNAPTTTNDHYEATNDDTDLGSDMINDGSLQFDESGGIIGNDLTAYFDHLESDFNKKKKSVLAQASLNDDVDDDMDETRAGARKPSVVAPIVVAGAEDYDEDDLIVI
jgi:hypothetical protein